MHIQVPLAKGWTWISIFTWSKLWEPSLSFPLSFLTCFGLKTYYFTLMEQKPGHSIGQNARHQSLHRESVCCARTSHPVLTSVCFPILCWCCTVMHWHQSRVALPQLTASAQCSLHCKKAFLVKPIHCTEEIAQGWLNPKVSVLTLKAASGTYNCSCISAVPCWYDWGRSIVFLGNLTSNLHFPNFVLKVLCYNKAT